MHVIFRESHGLDDQDTPRDLGQDPADLVVLSFSDSDLGAFAEGWKRGRDGLPSLRLANLSGLKHPLSVDTYIERTLDQAKGILIRLIGGAQYWTYGLQEVEALARRKAIALAVLPADGRPDERLDAASTLPVSVLRRLSALCDAGGAVASQAALQQLSLAAGLYAPPVPGIKSVPDHGWYDPSDGVIAALPETDKARIVISFYRSYLTAADLSPVDALIGAFRTRGYAAHGLFATSLKAPDSAAWIADQLAHLKPAAIVNATAFSARGSDGGPSPLDAPGCPVFQVALSTAQRRDWAASERGLSPSDLAMHVVLPEVDGRILSGAVSFKAPGKRDPDLQYSRFAHRADGALVSSAIDRMEGWMRLDNKAAADKSVAFVLSTYPGRDHQLAHAVGLDALASVEEMLGALAASGHSVTPGNELGAALLEEVLTWPVADYLDALEALPQTLRDDLSAAGGAPEADPAIHDGAFRFKAIRRGKALIALQPERGEVSSRDADYHDLSRTPRHAYVAFYLWLKAQGMDALVHVGAHGTLEWLPGKAVALSPECWPQALIAGMPVIYPFIVNDPGEAAQAKRRIGAVTLGHVPPPLTGSAVPDGLLRLEQLLDEYSTADGLDPKRRDRLVASIREEARACGVEADLGLDEASSEAEAVTRIDRFVCDIKESQFGDGLHVFGTGDHGAAEMAGLLAALAGKRVASGPSGSPFRGRADVLPTGRNLFTTDPRSVPSRAAHAQGVKLAEELVRRHLQDHGDWPRGLVVDLWGSATMRTAGEEFAMALHLAGLKPVWDHGSERVSGFEVLPPALLGRPRIDVTLRVSGLFRDVFPGLVQMFGQAVAALAARDEADDENPYRGSAAPRVFGPKPGLFGLAMGEALEDYSPGAQAMAGEAWLSGSEWRFTTNGEAEQDRPALEERVRAADAFVHVQDLAETDLLLASDYAAHEGGFAAARAALGETAPALYHLDATRPDSPQARTLSEEIGRVVRARAANPRWADGMMRHGFRGAAEIGATLDHLAAFANTTRDVPGHLFDLYHEATLGRSDVVAFMSRENPAALDAMRDRFRSLLDSGLWSTRRNSVIASLEVRP
ncbi:MAG: cobaltochelatase subunit CobN [Notoacmeibacter sp.]|nr:cobaltochelatase subunit CobN [Notoacmeibacter sp.]MCC0031980.1 cobaltochelatase subunit CobN [Brucellaceae bacterium]